MRMWRNWQTRTVQVRVSNIVKVRILSSAPLTALTRSFFMYELTLIYGAELIPDQLIAPKNRIIQYLIS